jgi:hypothetical protein
MVVQLGTRLIRSPPLMLEEFLPIESHLALEHVIDGTGQLMSQHSQGFACVVFFLQTGEVFLGRWMVAQEQDGGFRKGPLEMGIADLAT